MSPPGLTTTGLFHNIDFETISTCNRTCVTCLRNSHPDREAVASWFEPQLLPEEVIYEALEQAIAMGFRGGVILNFYNEPLMDARIPAIARKAKSYGVFAGVSLNTNGDYLTAAMAAELDGVLDHIIINLYMDEPIKSQRATWMEGLFAKTPASIARNPVHIATHFSPKFPVTQLATQHHQVRPCGEPWMHLILNHRRQYALCCEDVGGNFSGLGTFPEVSLREYWDGPNRAIRQRLLSPGGRMDFPYCATCPRQ